MPSPIEITAEMVAEAESLSAEGSWPAEIAEYWGISDRTLRYWRARGRDEGEGMHYELDRAIVRGEMRCRRGHVAVVTRAAREGNVSASQWFLERRFGWAARSKVEHVVGEAEVNDTDIIAELQSVMRNAEESNSE